MTSATRVLGALIVWGFVASAPCPVEAEPNAQTSIVLHAVSGGFGVCEIEDPCETPGGPVVGIDSPGPHVVYVMLRNYDNVVGLQCAFQWPAAWSFAFGLWDCQPSGGICEGTPAGSGPTLGTYACTFDCVTGGATAVIGRMTFNSSQEGCLEVIESAFPFGTHVLGCDQTFTSIDPRNRGRVCVGSGGLNACESVTPVESRTWGSIKAFSR
jgi:hypothetical protein